VCPAGAAAYRDEGTQTRLSPESSGAAGAKRGFAAGYRKGGMPQCCRDASAFRITRSHAAYLRSIERSLHCREFASPFFNPDCTRAKKRDFSRNRMPSLRHVIPQTCFLIMRWRFRGRGRALTTEAKCGTSETVLEKRCPFNQTSE